jgi:hypothetical protein
MMKKIFSILLALALVLSFGVVATPVSADQYSELTVNITAPLDSADIIGGTEFTVSANVTNNGSVYAFDVRATIEISGNATLQTGEVATKDISEDLPAGNTTQVSWDLVCTGGGTVNITVTPSGKDGLTHGIIPGSHLNPDIVSIIQEQVLEVSIVTPANYDAFNVTQYFDVTAKVENISSLNATEVELTIDIDRYAELTAGEDATQTVGILDSLDTSTNVTWTLECTGDGFSIITVSPSGKVEIEEVEEDIPDDALIPATVTVSQGDFVQASIELDEGWNLISLPLIPLDSDIEVVTAGIVEDIISVWYWAGSWDTFVPGAPSDLQKMEDGKAYWINMEAAQTLYIAGTVMPKGGGIPHDYDVVVGWNMVGFKSTNSTPAKDYLYGTEIARIYGFEDGAWFTIQGPEYNDNMVPGLGYWVAFTEPGTIYP